MKFKILVIDDDKYSRQFIKTIFYKSSYDVTTEKDVKTSVKRIIKEDFDLVITDLHMDGIDGIKGINIIKEIKPSLPVIVVTADEDVETERKARKAGSVVAYFLKPMEKQRLLFMVSSIEDIENRKKVLVR